MRRITSASAIAKTIQATAIHGPGVASNRTHAIRPVAAHEYKARLIFTSSVTGAFVLLAIQYRPATTGRAVIACKGMECQRCVLLGSVVTAAATANALRMWACQ